MLMSWLWESEQADAYLRLDWHVYLASVFAVLGVSIFAHGSFYRLIKQYEVTLLSPLTLMTPVMGVILGVIFLGETVTWQMLVGGVMREVVYGLQQRGELGPHVVTEFLHSQLNRWVPFKPEGLKRLLDDMVQEAGVDGEHHLAHPRPAWHHLVRPERSLVFHRQRARQRRQHRGF